MLTEIFKKPKPILGKVRLLALPGSPDWDGQWEALIARAEQEGTALAAGGVDGLIVENYHDSPHTTERMDVAGAIAMALLARRVKRFTGLPVGLSVLANDPETALAIALNAEADFIRLSVLAGALTTEYGVMNSRFNALLHYKNRLKVDLPPMLVDISRFHLKPTFYAPEESPLQRLAGMAEALGREYRQYKLMAFVISDEELVPEEWTALRERADMPVLLENRRHPERVDAYFRQADGLILEAGIRRSNGANPGLSPGVDMSRVEEMVNRLRNVVPVSEMDPDIFLQR